MHTCACICTCTGGGIGVHSCIHTHAYAHAQVAELEDILACSMAEELKAEAEEAERAAGEEQAAGTPPPEESCHCMHAYAHFASSCGKLMPFANVYWRCSL